MDSDFSGGGAIRVGDSTTTCDSAAAGAIRFDDSASDTLDYCDGSNWLTLLTSSIGAGVVNNGNSFAAPMIIGTNDNNTLSFETNGSTHMTIDTSGHVGIGTSSPGRALHVVDQGSAPVFFDRLEADSGTSVPSLVLRRGNSAGTGADGISSIMYFTTETETDETYEVAGRIVAVATDATAGTVDGDIILKPNNDGSPVHDAFIVKSSGYVGVGTATPGAPIHIYNSQDSVAKFESSNSAARIILEDPGSTTNGNQIQVTGDSMHFETAGSERLRINGTGNVGIGTSAPVNFGSSTDSRVLHLRTSHLNGDAELVLDSGDNSIGANPLITFAANGTKVGSIRSLRSGTGVMDGAITFETHDGASVSESMRISENGNVGIGTAAPAVALDVNTGSINAAEICDENNANCLDLSSGLGGGGLSSGDTIPAADGTNAAPGLTFASDTDTGIYRVGDNVLSIATNGTERMRIDASGNASFGGGNQTYAPLGVLSMDTSVYAPTGAFPIPSTSSSTYVGNLGMANGAFSMNYFSAVNSSFINQFGYVGVTSNSGAGTYTPDIVFGHSTGAFSYAEIVRFDSSGNVGIGTSAPAVELDVNAGSINAAEICDENNANCLDLSAGVGGGYSAGDTIEASTGSNGAPGLTFQGDTDTGMFRNGGSNQIGFATNGTTRMIIDNQGFRGVANDAPKMLDDAGAEATPSYTFVGETNTGMYLAADDNIGLVTGGSERLRIDENGFVGIGISTPDSVLHVEPPAAAADTAGANVKIYAQDSTGPTSSTGGDIFLEVGDGAGGWSSGFLFADVKEQFMAISKGSNTAYTPGSQPTSQLILENGWFVDGNSAFVEYEVVNASNYQSFWTGVTSSAGAGSYSPSYVWVQQTGASSYAERMRIHSNGSVGIGTTAPTDPFHVYDSNANFLAKFENTDTSGNTDGIIVQAGLTANPAAGTHFVQFRDGDGDVIGKIQGDGSGGVNYNTTSDRRIKRNIVKTQYTIEDILQIPVRDYNPIGSDKVVTGFIAQELYEVYPVAVSPGETEDEIWTVDYSRVTPLLAKGIQDIYGMCKATDQDLQKISELSLQNKRDIASLKQENQDLKDEVQSLKERLERIESLLENKN